MIQINQVDKKKTCSKCHVTKPLAEFNNDKNRKDGKYPQCKECTKEKRKDYYENRGGREHHKDWYENRGGREIHGKVSMYENKSCPKYIGVVVAERLIKHLFNDVEMMPHGFPGYDMICNKGKKVNVKASTICVRQNKNSTMNSWQFCIKYNKDCDFFLCMAFDNVIDLNPLMAWMIPADEVNDNSGLRISASDIHRWDKWKMDLNNAQACCDLMKGK